MKERYICQDCGTTSSKWSGKCNFCNSWDTIIPFSGGSNKKKGIISSDKHLEIQHIDEIDITPQHRIVTFSNEFDRVLGGGLVPGSVVLIGGEPGIGKSTLLLQTSASLKNVLYISAEESAQQICLRAKRLGLGDKQDIKLLTTSSMGDIEEVITCLPKVSGQLAIIDSIQTIYDPAIQSSPGTVAQVRHCAHKLTELAKSLGIILIIVSHVNKDGQIAGPKVLEHMVDTVLYFESDVNCNCEYRVLRTIKNRFGPANEIGIFLMTGTGLENVTNPSLMFLPSMSANNPGSTVFAGIEGTRPVLMEVQALLAYTSMIAPRRAVVGWDLNRLAMLVAVLGAKCNLSISNKEIYLNIAGGLKVHETAADLAIAAALISTVFNSTLKKRTVIFGEISLAGEIRKVPNATIRIQEACKMGFEHAIIPHGNSDVISEASAKNITLSRVQHIKDVISIYKNSEYVVFHERTTSKA